jgi:hypothetical protein
VVTRRDVVGVCAEAWDSREEGRSREDSHGRRGSEQRERQGRDGNAGKSRGESWGKEWLWTREEEDMLVLA